MDDAVCQHVRSIEEDFGDAWDAYQMRVNASIDNAKGAIVSVADGNIAVFRAGFADGSYPSYWGCDDTGEPVLSLRPRAFYARS